MSNIQVTGTSFTSAGYSAFKIPSAPCTCDPGKNEACTNCHPKPALWDPLTSKLICVDDLRGVMSNISGQIKTLIDAVIVDPRQNKASKDIVHKAIWSMYSDVVQWTYHECDRLNGTQKSGEFWPFPGGSPSALPSAD